MLPQVLRRLAVWAVIVAVALGIASFIGACQRMPSGDPKAYDVQHADVTVQLQQDASLLVTERLTFEYSGSFSGAYRDIPLQPGVTVSDVSLSDAQLGPYRPGGDTNLGSNDDPGKFGTVIDEGGGARVVWHYAQTDGTREFTLRYRVQGATRVYRDAVIVPWAVWGDQWDFWLDRLTARISGGGRPIEAWLRPGALGVKPTLADDGASIDVARSKPKQQVAFTAAFPPSAVRSTEGAAGGGALDGDGLAETRAAEDRAIGATPLSTRASDRLPLLLALLTGLCGIAAFVLFRGGRELDPGVPEHVNAPPDPLPPAVGYALAHEGGTTDRLVLATLLDLVDRGFYRGDATEGKELDLRLAIADPRADPSGLHPYERQVLDFFDALLAKGGPCALADLKDRIPEHSAEWRAKWGAMTASLGEAGNDLITWDVDLRARRGIVALVAVAGYGLLVMASLSRTGYWALPLAGLIAGLGLLYLLPETALQRRDPEASRRGAQWAAFAKWTEDFPRLDDDPPATLALWRRILVYAVAFGTAERVIESGRIPAPVQQEDDGWSRGLVHGSTYSALSGSSFGNGFSSQVAAESSSSSSGGGGGGGGGFSGGGGGGAW